MTRTSWRDDHRRIVKGRAVAYSDRDGAYEILMPFENVHGNGGLLTTVGDLLKWNENFASGVVGDAAFVREMETRGRYNDGREHGYALGLMVGTRHGLREVQHSGSTAGYRAHLTRFPDQRLSVAVLCNVSSGNATQYANAVAELFLGERARRTAPPRATHAMTDSEAEAASGMFRNTATGEALNVTRVADGVRLRGVTFVASSPTRFVSAGGDVWEVEGAGRARFTDDVYPTPDTYERAEPARPRVAELQELAGVYVSEDAEATLTPTVDGDVLVLRRRPNTTVRLSPLYKDAFGGSLGTVLFRRDAAGRVTALSLVQDRVWDMRFTRTGAVPPPAPTSGFAIVDRLMRDFAARERVPGAIWGIVRDGELVHVGTAGYRELSGKSPVTPDTVFRIASMTKSFTAMAILKLRDEGKLALDDPAEKYVPELRGLKYPTTDSPRITVRHLLTHAEGFPEDNPWGDQQLAVTEEEFSAMMRRGIPLSNAPGVAYEYSNYGFAILGRIVSNVSRMPYRDYVAAQILKPLGMTATTLEPRAVPADRLAHGYRWEDEQWKQEPQLPDGAFGAMGGMLTSLTDLARYVSVYTGAWPPRDGAETAPISRAALREMQQIWRSRPATATMRGDAMQLNAGGYGYGLRVSQSCDFTHAVAHSGGLPGFGSLMHWLPEYGVGILAMGNRTYTSWGAVATEALAELQKSGAIAPRVAKPSPELVAARDAVSQLVTEWDDRRADQLAAVNLFLDRSKERRRREIEALRAKVGACRPPDAFTFVENALRGTWTMSCERGNLDVSITLAPTMPPTVQYLEVTPARPQSRAACVVAR
jgi:CubicO group peptidase (beta-lactamase class C family)